MFKRLLFLVCILLIVGAGPSRLYADSADNNESRNVKKSVSRDLQKQVTNPLPVVLNLQIQNAFIPDSYESEGYANQLSFQPVIPIPLKNFPDIVIRPSVPALITTPEGTFGMGDISVLQGFVLPPSGKWGAWAVGPAISFPTATSEATGSGKWQAGVAAAVTVTQFPNWSIGLVLYNLTSFAGDCDRSSVNTLYVEPTLFYNFKGGWFLGVFNQGSSFNWENGGAPTIFAGIQGGRVFKIGSQPMSISLAPFYVPVHDGPSPQYGFQFNWTLLFPRKDQQGLN